ncbi:unnamed protein product [Tilletia controversa]|nr:unnamed protein product [Tilletia controversa]
MALQLGHTTKTDIKKRTKFGQAQIQDGTLKRNVVLPASGPRTTGTSTDTMHHFIDLTKPRDIGMRFQM